MNDLQRELVVLTEESLYLDYVKSELSLSDYVEIFRDLIDDLFFNEILNLGA